MPRQVYPGPHKISYRNEGTGNDWAGHSKFILFPNRTDSMINESLKFTLGATLPIGSK